MKHRITTTALTALALAFLSVSLRAQEDTGTPESVRGKVARVCVWGKWSGEALYVKSPRKGSAGDERYLKVELLDMAYSPAIRYKAGSPIVFCERKEVEDKTIYAPVVSVKLGSTVKSPLVLLFPGRDGKVNYRVFDMDASIFPYGGYQLVNLGRIPLLAKLDKQAIRIPAGKSKQLKGASKDGKAVWLRVASQSPSTRKTHLVYSSMLKNYQAKRMFMFFYQDDPRQPAKMAVKTLVDFRPDAQTP